MAPTDERPVFTLFYDVISPYSWILFEALQRYQKEWPIQLVLKPFALGKVMQETGNKPPMMVPARGQQMLRDLQRDNRYWGMNIIPPEDAVKRLVKEGSGDAQRFLVALQRRKPDLLVSASRAFWQRVWHDDKTIVGEESLREVAQQAGIDKTTLDQILVDIRSEEVRAQLKDNTQDAIDSGAYGAPWLVVSRKGHDDEAFFGSDRLWQVADLLGFPYLDGLRKYATPKL